MAAKLSIEDYALLADLEARGGVATISDNRPRQGADHLVGAGYATSRNLNVSVVEYEITRLGRIALVLKSYGLWSTDFSVIEPHRSDIDGLWRVKVSSDGDQALLMDIGSTTKLAIHLRAVGADDLTKWFEAETDRTRRYALSRLTRAS